MTELKASATATREARGSDISASQRGLWQAFLAAHQTVIEAVERDLRRVAPITLVEWEVIVRLRHAPGERLRFMDLSKVLFLTQSGVSKLVGRMAEKGYVRKEVTDTNYRATFAILTPAGDAMFEKAHATVEQALARHFFARIDARDEAAFGRALTVLRDKTRDE